MRSSDHDVVIVGECVAGWVLATSLAGADLTVAVVEPPAPPSETGDIPVVQAEGVGVLSRLGVLEELLAVSTAPLIGEVRIQIDDHQVVTSNPTTPGGRGFLNVGSTILDQVLSCGARAAGTLVMPDTIARSLLIEDGRVVGVQVEGPDGPHTLRARLVIGADGVHSWVGQTVGARRYHVRPVSRVVVWADYPEHTSAPFVSYAVVGDRIGVSAHSGSGLRTIGTVLPSARWAARCNGSAAALDTELRRFAWIASTLDSTASREVLVSVFRPPAVFMRQTAGPGWVLVGDAGHFLDPTPGQGVSDALRHGERLADHLVDSFVGPLHPDTASYRFWRWRDADVVRSLHWGGEHGVATMPQVARETLASTMQTREGARGALGLLAHHPPTSGIRTSDVVGTAVAGVLSRRRSAAEVTGEVLDLARDARDRASPRRPPETERAPTHDPAVRPRLDADVVDVDGVCMPVLVGGSRHAGDTVVFVHGTLGSGTQFAGPASMVADQARVVVPDLQGVERADEPAVADHSLDGYADALGAVIDCHRSGPVHVVAHDVGVLWALEWVVRNPGRVGSLTLVDGGVSPGVRWHRLAGLCRTPVVGEAVMALWDLGGAAAWRSRNHTMPRPIPDRDLRHLHRDLQAGTRKAVLQLHRAEDGLADRMTRWLPTLRVLDVPVLVVWGAHDRCLPVEQAMRQAGVFSRAEVAVFDDSGHWPHLDDPCRFAATVVPFLRGAMARGLVGSDR